MKLEAILESQVSIFNTYVDGDVLLVEADKYVRNTDGFAVALQSGMAVKALRQYMANHRKMVARFQATTQNEKNLYKSIVKDLLATNQYTVLKSRMVGGGWLWELQRKQDPL